MINCEKLRMDSRRNHDLTEQIAQEIQATQDPRAQQGACY
jgi:hypothetical protein